MNLPQGEQMGFIAPDLDKVIPQLVKTIVDKEEDNEKVPEYTCSITLVSFRCLLRPFRTSKRK